MGNVLLTEFDWRGADAEYRRALAPVAKDADALYALARLQAAFGEPEHAVEFSRQALAFDPLRAPWYSWLAFYLSSLNRLDEAERATRKAIELQPGAAVSHQRLTIIAIQREDARAALTAAEQEPPGSWRERAIALAMQIGGDRSAADAALKTLIEKTLKVRLTRSPRCTRSAMTRRRPSSGSIAPGTTAMQASSTCSPTPSWCAIKPIRASQPSVTRWDFLCQAKLPRGS